MPLILTAEPAALATPEVVEEPAVVEASGAMPDQLL
jgi:hypothetical protein